MKMKLLSWIFSVLLIFSLSMTAAISVSAYSAVPLDVGNFNDYDDGGDDGGDYNDGGYTYYDNDDSGSSSGGSISFDNPIFWIVAAAIIAIAVFGKVKGGNKGQTSGSPVPQSRVNTSLPADFTSRISEEIMKRDPKFSGEKFIAWSKDVFVTLQNAWTERDWAKIRPFEKDDLYNMHAKQLEEYTRLGRINIIERINVNQAYLHKYVRDENYEYLTVYMGVRMRDYIIDENTKAVLMGKNDQDCFMKYLLTFMRQKDVLSTENMGGVKSESCPHCGAPVEVNSAGMCEYCGSVVTSGEHNWVLSDMEAVKRNTNIDNTGIIIREKPQNPQNPQNPENPQNP